MIKILVVVSGLMMLVPDGGSDPSGLTALAVAMPPHKFKVMRRLDPKPEVWVDDANPGPILLQLRQGLPTINLQARDDFARLGDVVTGARVHPGCLSGICLDSDLKNRVSGLVRFQGGWRTRPATRCVDLVWPLEVTDQAKSELRRTDLLNTANPPPRPFATALVLEADVVDLHKQLVVKIGPNEPKILTPSENEFCDEYLGDDGVEDSKCVIIEIENWSKTEIDSDCRKTPCDETDIPEKCRRDEHFRSFFDLLEAPPTHRWEPYVVEKYCNCDPPGEGPGQPPSPRCPPTFVSR